MKNTESNASMVAKRMFRLLPIQILLAAVGAVNGIVSSLFASNFVGEKAMSAVALYAPVNQFVGAVSLLLVGGSQILCGEYMGKNQLRRTGSVFSLDILISAVFAGAVTAALLAGAALDLIGASAPDGEVRALFNRYTAGQAIGVVPLVLGQQLAAFLSLENRTRCTMAASLVFIAVNVALNGLFVAVMGLGAFGLALAPSLGLWVFLLVQAGHYFSGESLLRFRLRDCRWRDTKDIVRIGAPGSLSQGYQTVRRLIVNALITRYVGGAGLSAFGASDALLGLVWAVPMGMLAVSRMMMSVSIGEEDRQTLTDVMRTAMGRFVPVMCAVAGAVIACAVPLTRLYYRDTASAVYEMTVWGFRILPLCMPLSVICMHFVCYGQASNKQALVHTLSVLDGVACVALFSALLVPGMGIRGVYIANVLNGVVCALAIGAYSWLCRRRFPRTMDELMVIPADFGVPEDRRLDLTVRTTDEVVRVSERVQGFCARQGLDERRALLAGLFLEEMAGNVVSHGFSKDRKSHCVDVRAACKGDDVILRLRDDCVPFDPAEREKLADPEDITHNIGIRMVFRIAKNIQYQNILGLNVLTIRV